MSEPTIYDKAKWDTSLGLDYGKPPHAFFSEKYAHHEFPPLFKGTRLISQYDLEGRGDGFQLAKQGNYLYFCHMFSSGFSVVDVKDPTAPEVVAFVSTGNPHVWSIKCRVMGNLLLVNNEWKFFEPSLYHLNAHLPNIHDRAPLEPVQAGIKIYDVSKPAKPKLISFFKTGEWSKEGGGTGCHRFWFDGHYAYISAEMPGYFGNIMLIVDVSNPKDPKEVSRFWLPGQWIAGGERPWWPLNLPQRCQHHHPIVQGDRAYTTWFGLGGAIVDVSTIKRPTLVSQFNYDMGGQNHTFLPIKNRQFAIFISEYRHAYMLDISDEKYPKVVAMFPRPPKELLKRGVGVPWGPSIHNIHENVPGPDSFRSDDIIYAACGPGGLRIYDVSDPYRIDEVGYYVPGTPKVYYDPRGPEHGSVGAGVDLAEVYVDREGLMYCSSYNGGLEILEFTG